VAADPAISIRGVRKRFGQLTAVDGLDLEVEPGICFGLLGPNGAGKSTTMRMLTAQALADEGDIRVLGHVVPADSKAARLRMGVCPQQDNLDVELTVGQTLEVFARLYRVPRGDRAAAIDRALSIARLTARRDDKVNELSGGMRRRLLIGRALVHRPDLVLLDEPTVGLDPQVRQELWTLIDGLRSEGVTVLMSTHYIEEAERLADVVGVMAAGQVVALGRPDDLVREHAGREVIEVYGPPSRLAEVDADAAARGWQTRRSGPAVAILRAEELDGAGPEGERRAATLEDAFVMLTGEDIG
jgi:lipooligosaccharide transport system ATP-binding protein